MIPVNFAISSTAACRGQSHFVGRKRDGINGTTLCDNFERFEIWGGAQIPYVNNTWRLTCALFQIGTSANGKPLSIVREGQGLGSFQVSLKRNPVCLIRDFAKICFGRLLTGRLRDARNPTAFKRYCCGNQSGREWWLNRLCGGSRSVRVAGENPVVTERHRVCLGKAIRRRHIRKSVDLGIRRPRFNVSKLHLGKVRSTSPRIPDSQNAFRSTIKSSQITPRNEGFSSSNKPREKKILNSIVLKATIKLCEKCSGIRIAQFKFTKLVGFGKRDY